MKQLLRYILFGVLLIAFQATVVRFFSIEGVTPDLVTIYLVYVSLKEGQIAGTVSGFVSGLLLDFVSGDFLGLGALTKTVCGFIAGYFYDEYKVNQLFGTYRFFFAVLLASLVHNIIYFAVYLYGTELSVTHIMLQYGLGATAYTCAVSLIPIYWKKK